MCGIVGFNFQNKELLENMKISIKHRGPDDEGSFFDEFVSLGHVRLSILDLSNFAHQPMVFDNLVLVYNGEVYNFEEIRKELIKYGYVFNSKSDSEVVLKAYHKWGKEAVNKFRGMFAFCIYDKKEKKLTLFRDRVGIKPLYYYFDGKNFLFGSEVRAIRKFKKLNVNKLALSEFFGYGYISENLSIFENVKKLLPAHYLEFDLIKKDLKIKKYWDVRDYSHVIWKKEEEIVEELESILVDSIKLRMKSDVNVGVFLSGGVDSSLVASILQKHYGEIHTFTIGFKEEKYNEANYAKKVAKHIGSFHTEEVLDVFKAREILKKFVDIYDEPFGDSSGIPTFFISEIAKENGIKVVLNGDGGDELFCGYDRYWISYNLGKKFVNLPFKTLLLKILDICENYVLKFPLKNMEHKYKFLKNILKATSWEEIYDSILKQYRDDIENLGLKKVNIKGGYFTSHPIEGMMLWDFYNYLPNDILVKVDRATMKNSIEGREPLLDNKIIEYSATIPFELKCKNGNGKYILKRVLERYLPKELIYRKKQGFGIPLFEWFKNDLIKLFDEYFYEDDIIDMRYPRKLLNDFKNGKYVNVNKLWFVLVYKMWKEKYY